MDISGAFVPINVSSATQYTLLIFDPYKIETRPYHYYNEVELQ